MTLPKPVGASPPSSRRPSRWRRAALAMGLGGGIFCLWLISVWPPPIWYRWFWPHETAFMSMREGQADSLARHVERRRDVVNGTLPRLFEPVPLSAMASTLPQAVMIAEDHRFFEHQGVDYQAIRQALGYRRDAFEWANPRDRAEMRRVLGQLWVRRERIRGASTITQQLAKNLYLSPSRNPFRKVKEAVTAYRLESALGKNRILELYLNVVELGPEVWGVEAASRQYFGRPAARLSPDQAAALAGTLPFPLRSNPGYRPGRMRWRQQFILRRLAGEPIQMPADADSAEAREPAGADTVR